MYKVLLFLLCWTSTFGASPDARSGCVTTNFTIVYGTVERVGNPLSMSEAEVAVSELPLQLDQIINMICGSFRTQSGLGPLKIANNTKYITLIQAVEISMMSDKTYTLDQLKKCIEYGSIIRVFEKSIGSRFGKIYKKEATGVTIGGYGTKEICCRKKVCACSQGTCKNYGSCSDTPIGFVCACRPGFGGQRCEKVVPIPVKTTTPPPLQLDRKVEAIVLFAVLCLEGAVIAGVAFYYQTGVSSARRYSRNRSESFDSLNHVNT